jgi:dienelactone hydrolase
VRSAPAAIALAALLVAGCGPSGADSEPRTSGAGVPSVPATGSAPEPAACGPGASAFWLPGPDRTRLEANSFGRGRAAAVFLHEAGRTADMCGFWPFAQWLARRRHVLVVLVNRCTYGASTCQVYQRGDAGIISQTRPAVEWARRHGAGRVTLVGASTGASDALQAAGVVPHVAAVVDLSGDVTDTGADDRTSARRLRVPALLAVAPGDDVSPVATMRAVYRLVPARPKRLVIVRDAFGEHGWDLLHDPEADRFTTLARLIGDWVVGDLR